MISLFYPQILSFTFTAYASTVARYSTPAILFLIKVLGLFSFREYNLQTDILQKKRSTASHRMEQVEQEGQKLHDYTLRPARPTIIIPETWGTELQEGMEPKPWDLEVIRNERAARRKVQFSEATNTSCRRHGLSFGARTDGGSDINDGPATNPFLDSADDIAPDDRSGMAHPGEEFYNDVTIATPSGDFAAVRSPPLEKKPTKSRRKTESRYQGMHPFVPGKVRHRHPGEVNGKHYTQYVYSSTHTDYVMTHHYLCETSDLDVPVYYYHDVGGHTRLDPNHRFTLHHGNHSGTPILGTMWHNSAGIHFAVGNPYMNLMDKDNENVTTIQRQHCDYLKPISAAPSRWHMDFSFGGGEKEGPKKFYRWQVVHLAEAIPHLRHGKLELREKHDGDVDEKGKKRRKGKLLAACRNVDDLGTNLWVREPSEELGSDLARLKWETWVLLTWGAMRDRMRGPHNTGSPHHNVGYTKSTRVVELPESKLSVTNPSIPCMSLPTGTVEIRERTLNPEEY